MPLRLRLARGGLEPRLVRQWGYGWWGAAFFVALAFDAFLSWLFFNFVIIISWLYIAHYRHAMQLMHVVFKFLYYLVKHVAFLSIFQLIVCQVERFAAHRIRTCALRH
jgi:hypothetical protein